MPNQKDTRLIIVLNEFSSKERNCHSPFLHNISFLYPLKRFWFTSQRFSDFFRGYTLLCLIVERSNMHQGENYQDFLKLRGGIHFFFFRRKWVSRQNWEEMGYHICSVLIADFEHILIVLLEWIHVSSERHFTRYLKRKTTPL